VLGTYQIQSEAFINFQFGICWTEDGGQRTKDEGRRTTAAEVSRGKLRKQKVGLGSNPLLMLAVSRPDIKGKPEGAQKVLENMKNRR